MKWLMVVRRSLLFSLLPACAASAQRTAVPEWRLEQDIRIGEVNGPAERMFTRPTMIVIGRDSSIIVQDGVQIRWFNARGQFIRTFGRSGNGPGEFKMGIGDIGFLGDTIYAIDIFSQRITLFSTA